MKNLLKSFLAFCFLYSMSAIAQPTISASGVLSTIGDVVVYTTDTTTSFNPGSSGANQTWNFTGLHAHTSSSTIYVDPSTTPFASDFPAANIAGTSGQNIVYIFQSNNRIENYGAATATVSMPYMDPEDLIHFPFSMGSSYTDSWMAVFNSGAYTFYRTGTTTVTADGYGTLQTPVGSYVNALRVHLVQNYQDSTFIGVPYIITYSNDEYMWYENGTHSVISTMYEFTSSLGGTTQRTNYLQSINGVNSLPNKNALVISPNPAVETINLSLTEAGNTQAEVVIYNSIGEKVKSLSGENFPVGTNNIQINIADLPQGIYFLHLINDGVPSIAKQFEILK